jgi:histidinol phosphatase-like enzyme
MILAAAADLSLDLEQSWLIGDAQRDVEAAVRAGIVAGRALQVSTPEIPGFLDAVRRVLESGTRRARHDG